MLEGMILPEFQSWLKEEMMRNEKTSDCRKLENE